MNGQINLNTNFGKFINEISSFQDNKVFVEIGTWNGQGSTYCVMESLLRREDETSFYSLECDMVRHIEAVALWKKILENNPKKDILKLLHGRVVEIGQVYRREELKELEGFFNDWYKWYDDDIKNFELCENILDEVPSTIDVLILDGGEFSTFAEFSVLFDRVKNYIILDDCNILKCKNIYKILSQHSEWQLYKEDLKDRNGYAIFKKSA